MSAGPTKFPWVFKDMQGGTCRYALESPHDISEYIYLGGECADANRRLLEALPQMVEALRNVAKADTQFVTLQSITAEVRDALRAAGLLEPDWAGPVNEAVKCLDEARDKACAAADYDAASEIRDAMCAATKIIERWNRRAGDAS